MMKSFEKVLLRSGHFVRDNPQIIYTIFLVIALPLAFLWTAERFLEVSSRNQERLEEDRIATMHDVFVGFARDHMEEETLLQKHVEEFSQQNESFTTTRVVRYPNRIIIASNNSSEINTEDKYYERYYELAGPQAGTIVFEELDHGVRVRPAFRAIVSDGGQLLGHLATVTSMEHIDAIARTNIKHAYWLLLTIIVAVMVLLLRHTRIIDYATLYQRLKEVDQMKDDFISIASHELRTPITALRWQIDLFKDNASKNIVTPETLQASIDQLERLIEDILDVSRIEQGRAKMDIRAVEITTLVEQTVTLLKPTAFQKNLALTYEKGNKVQALVDPDRFRQVVTNIIGNAIKYTPTGSVAVSMNEEKNRIVVRVRDTGIGISAEEQKNLFQKFYRIKSTETRDIRGTGLGLWITKQIVEAMGGSIYLESMKGVGSTFIITLPKVMNTPASS